MKRLVLAFLIAWVAAAFSSPPPPPPPPPPAASIEPLPVGTKASCALLAKVEEVPFRPTEPPPDPTYRFLFEHRTALQSCLVEAITNASEMPDPRPVPKVDGYAVGDLAYGLLGDFYGVPFEDLLPADVQVRYRDNGYFAYFEWIRKPGSRRYLQQQVREWLRLHAKAALNSKDFQGPPHARRNPATA